MVNEWTGFINAVLRCAREAWGVRKKVGGRRVLGGLRN